MLGQAAALNQQKAADNVASVIDAELVGRLPDQNLAEAVSRVPGVAIFRDQGEGRFIQIRGIDANLNSLSINGERVASPEQNSRQVPMDVIPADMIAAIQVSKTLTPDMDADAIGGNVNLVTRTPLRGQRLASVSVAGGLNQINDGPIANGTAYLGRRFGASEKLGVVVGGNYWRNDRGSQNYEGGWCVSATCRGVTGAQVATMPTQLDLRDYPQVDRTRWGFNGTVDYEFDARNTVFLKGLFSRFDDDEQRFRSLYNFAQGTIAPAGDFAGTATGGRQDREIRLRRVNQSILSLQLGGRHAFYGGSPADWSVARNRATEDRPDVLTAVFRQSNMDFGFDLSDQANPRVSVTRGDQLDASRFGFNSFRQQVRDTRDDEWSVRANATRPVRLGTLALTLKTGVVARLKDRDNAEQSNRFTSAIRPGFGITGPLTLATLGVRPGTDGFLSGSLPYGPTPAPDAIRTLWANSRGALTFDSTRSRQETAAATFAIGEDVYAGYLMATADVGKLRLIPGLRVEHTRVRNSASLVQVRGQQLVVTPREGASSYTNVFPGITARLSVDEQTVVRGAVTTSLVRPNFRDMAPFVDIPDGNAVTAAIGNPALRPTYALNYDLMVERYLKGVGFVSAGVFHKRLNDFITPVARAATTDDQLGPTVQSVTQNQNGQTGRLTGIEVAWQQTLTFLPAPLRGFGVNANYTWTTSRSSLTQRAGETFPLPGQAGNAANAGLFYDRGPLSLRVGVNFSDRFLEELRQDAANDIYVAARTQVDASGAFRVTDRARIFVEAINLTDQPLRRYQGDPRRGWEPGNEWYRRWATVGVRVNR